MTDLEPYLSPTHFIDSDAAAVVDFAQRGAGDATDPTDKAIRLFYAVRDGLRYDPYALGFDPAGYRASAVAEMPAAYCIQKSVLYAGALRAVGVPSRLGFADVRNHLTSPKLRAVMGSDLFLWHGFTEVFLEGRWVKATAVFDKRLCARFGVMPLDFDGKNDSILHPFDAQNRRHMEYVNDRGTFVELPFDELMRAFRTEYPGLEQRIAGVRTDEVFASRSTSGDSV